MGAGNYAPSTRARIADLITGMHVKTTDAVLVAANFTTGGTNTTLFNIHGRIGIMQLFVELTAAADVNATQVAFYVTFTTPVIALNLMCAKCDSIASLGAHGRIAYIGGVVATQAIISDSAGLSDATVGYMKGIVGGETAAGANTVGVIGMQASDATQAATISATGHLFYIPLSVGAYAEAAL